MNETELYELLQDLGLQKLKRRSGRKGINIMFCCPFHGENHPSAGVVLEGHSVYGGCFACKESFTLPKLIAQCNGITEWEAIQELNERYFAVHRTIHKTRFKEYGEVEVKERFILPITKIAPFRSGKATHKYFYERGFNEDTLKKFLVGWDRVRKRITVPVFYQDGILMGIMGRAIFEMGTEDYEVLYGEEPKYHIYENYPIGDVLFGEHLFPKGNDTAIIVEGTFDLLWMHQLGFINSLSTIIANFTEQQREVLFKLGVKNVVLFYDDDAAGRIACKKAYELLKPFFKVFIVTYPEAEDDEKQDVMDLDQEQIQKMLDNKRFYWKKSLVRRD